MEIFFRNKKLEQSLTEDKSIIKTYGALSRKIKQRIVKLRAANELSTIAKIPVLRLHPYKGNRTGEWSIDIQENWRICFEINHDPIPVSDDGGIKLEQVTAIKIISPKLSDLKKKITLSIRKF